ncbi:exonuclease domain-containing protein [Pedobacter sp.]|jgi:DNA polymerase-3 subunit epsilon|uniref:exonuclease domain-containing protein n=1 Tax=Pedobacter sp. TaxID=1411316 RepID=UPI002CA36305|nr:exonuclease domain-containing protein [Pedobacter sp.]HWW42533.1 exonuclease domain-containing protein [Pedobacter sp.]
MQFAVVDIETTGGYASGNGITEISIQIHDGTSVTERFDTLINPEHSIPAYIESLTGISDEMVASAPKFEAVAERIYDLLHDKIFVAHNVNFDFSFVRHQLEVAGYNLQCKKLCTVRMSRKVFPGFASYSLGKLCNSLGITLNDRHRAGGDAEATAILLGMLLEADQEGHIKQALNKGSKEQALPPNLPKSAVDALPQNPGVYYFKDQKGNVIYIGKAKNLKKRVCSHFTGNNLGPQRQDFLKNIHHVEFEVCGTELMAFILEAVEIKRLWPENNRAMKRFEQKYSLFSFIDQNGYIRLGIDKFKKQGPSLYNFNSLSEGHSLLRMLIKEHLLCERLCFIQKNRIGCVGHEDGKCSGACVGKESAAAYNVRVKYAIQELHQMLPSFAVIDQGRTEDEQSCLWVEKGQFYGMGYISQYTDVKDMSEVKSALKPLPSNDYILHLILSYADAHPGKKLSIEF